MFFGLTTNSFIQIKSPEGLQFSNIYFDPAHPNPDWIKSVFQQTDIKKINFNKLILGFGTWSYYVSPNGAQKLTELIFPLSLQKTEIPLINCGQSRIIPFIV